MRAVTVSETHRLVVTEVPEPDVSATGVLVRVRACGICGSDLHLMEMKLLPIGAVLGHEAAGVVEAVGSDVSELAVGDHIAIQPFDPCGMCEQCRAGASQRCVNNAL